MAEAVRYRVIDASLTRNPLPDLVQLAPVVEPALGLAEDRVLADPCAVALGNCALPLLRLSVELEHCKYGTKTVTRKEPVQQ
jgi:hypothetical protein